MRLNGTEKTRLHKGQENNQPMPYDIQGTFGWKLRNERKKQRLSQEHLAEMAGCSVDTVKRYEAGCAGIRLDTAWYLAEALQIPFELLLPTRNGYTKDQLLLLAEELIRTARERN